MLILNGRRFIEAPFKTEEELEQVVAENSESIFGPSSIFLPTKKLISQLQELAKKGAPSRQLDAIGSEFVGNACLPDSPEVATTYFAEVTQR